MCSHKRKEADDIPQMQTMQVIDLYLKTKFVQVKSCFGGDKVVYTDDLAILVNTPDKTVSLLRGESSWGNQPLYK